jgi:endonuclease YncB( thermonuclease family)
VPPANTKVEERSAPYLGRIEPQKDVKDLKETKEGATPNLREKWQVMALIGVVIAVVFWSRQGWIPATRQGPALRQEPAPHETGASPRVLTRPVVQVVDGATIDVQLDGHRVHVRYLGIHTPETTDPATGVEPFGPEVEAANRQLVEGQTVRLELDVQPWDRYQRLLAYVYVGDLMVNAELVRQGYAQVAPVPPNVKYHDRFRALQQEAREAQRGVWRHL